MDMIESAMSLEKIKHQVSLIQQVMSAVMRVDEHYGTIPGTNKPTLLKPGAEKLCQTFRLGAFLEGHGAEIVSRDMEHGHREYTVRLALVHLPSGTIVGHGIGVCGTMESKYRWRKQDRQCPSCGTYTILRSKFEKNGDRGWYCYAKIGGCGEEFDSNDPEIVTQITGRSENPDPADSYNTTAKMAKKRALVDAVLTATAASDIFTQDVEDQSIMGRPAVNDRVWPDSQEANKPAVMTRGDFVERLNGRGLLSSDSEGIVQEWAQSRRLGPDESPSSQDREEFARKIDGGQYDSAAKPIAQEVQLNGLD